jgi:hypothetical protein
LTKSPVAFSGSSSAKFELKAVDVTVQRMVGEPVDIDRDRLADLHMGQLRFLEIGDDVDLVGNPAKGEWEGRYNVYAA